MPKTGSGTYTLESTRTTAFSWADVKTVIKLVAYDIEDLANRSRVSMYRSLGPTLEGLTDNHSLTKALCGDLTAMFESKYVVSCQLVFYDPQYNNTEGGYALSYRASYDVWSPGPDMASRVTRSPSPLPPWPNGAVDRFGALVVWSDLFRDILPQERNSLLSQLSFRWIKAPRFLGGQLPPPQELPPYGSGGSGFALRRSVQFKR